MDYVDHYNKLIDKAKNRLLEGYVEWHHIVPRCMGGNDDSENLVALTAREHYVAHQLLVKMYPNEPKLVLAVRMMTLSSKKLIRNNREYGWIKEKYTSWHKGKTGVYSGETLAKMSAAKKGRKLSAKTRQKMSEARTGRKQDEDWNSNISSGRKEMLSTSEGRLMIKKVTDNLNSLTATCPHCNKKGQLGAMKRWHFDNCKVVA